MNIEKYVNQLIEDIEILLQNKAPYMNYVKDWNAVSEGEEQFEAKHLEFEDHVHNHKGASVLDYSGIAEEQLPDAELLSEGQLGILLNGLVYLLEHYNIILDFPQSLPDKKRYSCLRKEWRKLEAPLIPYHIYYEFCSYDVKDCPFPEYCNFCSVIGESEGR